MDIPGAERLRNVIKVGEGHSGEKNQKKAEGAGDKVVLSFREMLCSSIQNFLFFLKFLK